MRRLCIVAYDISDPKRLRKVFRTLKGYGQHLQLSLFRCDLTSAQRLQLSAKLRDIIDLARDKVMFVDLGPSVGQSHNIDFLGIPGPAADFRGPKVF